MYGCELLRKTKSNTFANHLSFEDTSSGWKFRWRIRSLWTEEQQADLRRSEPNLTFYRQLQSRERENHHLALANGLTDEGWATFYFNSNSTNHKKIFQQYKIWNDWTTVIQHWWTRSIKIFNLQWIFPWFMFVFSKLVKLCIL